MTDDETHAARALALARQIDALIGPDSEDRFADAMTAMTAVLGWRINRVIDGLPTRLVDGHEATMMIARPVQAVVKTGDLGEPPTAAPADMLVWSEEHGAWWKPASRGYTTSMVLAGRYPKELADQIVRDSNFGGRFNEVAVPEPAYQRVGGLKEGPKQ